MAGALASAQGCARPGALHPPAAAHTARRAGRKACPSRRGGVNAGARLAALAALSAAARTDHAGPPGGPPRPLTVTCAGGEDQPGAALAAAAQKAALQFGEAAFKGALNALSSPDTVAPEQLTVSEEQVAAECAALGLVLGERLGKGSRATVFSAVGAPLPAKGAAAPDAAWRATPGQTVAVKALLDDVSPPTLAELASEAELWGALRNDGIVRMMHASLSPAPLLVLEACEGGTLFAALRRGDPLDVRALTLDVAKALAAVHAAGQAHRDVKSANVLLTRAPGADARLTAKLCDWGSASLLKDSLPARPLPPAWPSTIFAGTQPPAMWTPVGTLLWMAPEMLDPHVEGTKPPKGASGATADVYSFGILLWEMLERRLPWVEPVKVKRVEVLRVVIKEGKRLPISDWVSKEVRAQPPLHARVRRGLTRRGAAGGAAAAVLGGGSAQAPYDGAGAADQHASWRRNGSLQLLTLAYGAQVVSRLSALKAWDTDGRLERLAREKAVPEPQAAPVKAMFSDSVRAAVRTSGNKSSAQAMSPGELVRAHAPRCDAREMRR